MGSISFISYLVDSLISILYYIYQILDILVVVDYFY